MSRDAFKQMAVQLEADGYAKGYKQGLKDAKREFLAMLERLGEGCASGSSQSSSGGASQRKPRENSDQARVLAVIAANPGLRGVDVVEKLKQGESPVHERTVRTALSRLRRRGQIVQREGGWHPVHAH